MRRVRQAIETVGVELGHDRRTAIRRPVEELRVRDGEIGGECGAHFLDAVVDVAGGERAAVEEMLVNAVGPEQAPFGVAHQRLIEAGDLGVAGAVQARVQRAAAGKAKAVGGAGMVGVAQAPLGIPQDEAPERVGRALAARAPVVGRPVAHRDVGVEQAVVGEVHQFESLAHGGVLRCGGDREQRSVPHVGHQVRKVIPISVDDA